MKSSIIRVVVSCYLILTSMVSGSYSQCSCYTFYSNITNRDWDVGSKECKANGGDLVSMETLAEWEFIKTQIQNRTTSSGYDEWWWIGLVRENGIWRWLSNHNLTYNKWKPQLDLDDRYRTHAIIEKQEGTLWNIQWYKKMGSICEQKRTDCKAKQVKWCDNVTTTSPPTTIMRDSITVVSRTLQDVVQNTDEPTISFIAGHTTPPVITTSTAKDDKGVASSKTEEPFPVVIVILVVALLAIIVIIIICVCRRKRKNKDKKQRSQETGKMNKEEQDKFILQPHSGNGEKYSQESPCIYATVDNTTKPVTRVTSPEYAEVKKPDEDEPKELNYAVLSDFTADDKQGAQRPEAYEPTEYATVNV